MTKKVLFVDDEKSLLNGIDRRLGLEFDIETAISGRDALAIIKGDGPFAVVVTDMQMPEMNGIEFIQHARKIAPDTVYLMLTGNQDIGTATEAINEGKVFRFLNKPCESDEIKRAVEISLRQYQLVTGEKELLHKTFVGAVGLLTEVLEVSHPEIFSEVPHVEQIFGHLRLACGMDEHWEYKLVARFGMLGIALLPDEERKRFYSLSPTDPEADKLLQKSASVAGRMVGKIPRLQTVSEIVKHQYDIDGTTQKLASMNRVVQLGATFLRIAIKWNLLNKAGTRGDAALDALQAELPNLALPLADALLEFDAQHESAFAVEVAIGDLKEGMVLAHDIVTEDGAVLLREGRLLSSTAIEKLHICQSENQGIRAIKVIESTCPTEEAASC